MDLDKMMSELRGGDLEGMRRVGRAWLEQTGDIPLGVIYTLGFIQLDAPAAWDELEAMRPAGAKPYDWTGRI